MKWILFAGALWVASFGCGKPVPPAPANLVWDVQGELPPVSRLEPLPGGQAGAAGAQMIRGPGRLTMRIAADEQYVFDYDGITIIPFGDKLEGLLIYLAPRSVEDVYVEAIKTCDMLHIEKRDGIENWYAENRRANQRLPMHGDVGRELPNNSIGVSISRSLTTDLSRPFCVAIGMNFRAVRKHYQLPTTGPATMPNS
jgi:hypothetical protein